MLLLAHVGYTVGGGWAAQRLRLKNPIDFRLLAFMALFPDIVDRTLYLFLIPDAISGRLIAHTLIFQLALFAVLVVIRKGFWVYGLASLMHLALDGQGLSAHHAFWPLLGSGLENIDIVSGSAAVVDQSFGERVFARLEVDASNYSNVDLIAMLFEFGGVVVLAAFSLGARLYDRSRLRRLLRHGEALPHH